MYGKPAMTCLNIRCTCWFRNHHISECYVLSGYRASAMSQAPALTSTLCGSITFAHLEDNSKMVKLPHQFKKQRGNPYGRRTVNCKITIPKQRVVNKVLRKS
jgi:hypothetical protein